MLFNTTGRQPSRHAQARGELKERAGTDRPTRILLCGVFGPYGVDDAYGTKDNIMELFHNQVTKAQGMASLRLLHRTFGLYFLAANVEAEVTVLDFPSRRRFVREIKKQYDLVGISFIAPNFAKAKDMAGLLRKHAPQSEIALGGHGAAIENLDQLIDCDHIVRGDGISWLRAYLGQDTGAPICHPTLPSNESRRILGVPVTGPTASLLAPGVGCPNGCRFCSTSHFFDKEYIPFLQTGGEIFELACRMADQTGSDAFFVMDENFLKQRDRALELLRLMQLHQRWFRFSIFSSADTVLDFGIDNLVRLGVELIWIGVESKTEASFDKNAGIDFRELIQTLRDHGIGVLASGILCLEDHTPESMQEDIDFLVDLRPDLIQFMLLTGLPVTGLYQQLKKTGRLRQDLDLAEWHGQKELNFRHPKFRGNEPEQWLQAAFATDYQRNGSSICRLVETAVRGARTLEGLAGENETYHARHQQIVEQVRRYRPLLPLIKRYAVNDGERSRAEALELQVEELLGSKSLKDFGLELAAGLSAAAWSWRIRLLGDRIQPRTIVRKYPAASRSDDRCPARTSRSDQPSSELQPGARHADVQEWLLEEAKTQDRADH